MKSFILGAHLTGQVIPLGKVPDAAFSSRTIGDGAAIEPRNGKLIAPADGKINLAFSTKHALGMITDDGIEILMHIGIDTVKLNGKCFELHVTEGQKVKRGDLLITFDIDGIRKAGYSTITPIVITNMETYNSIHLTENLKVKAGEDNLLEVLK